MIAYWCVRNIAMTLAPTKPPIKECDAPFDPRTGLLNVRKMHSWRDGPTRLDRCRLCRKTRKELAA